MMRRDFWDRVGRRLDQAFENIDRALDETLDQVFESFPEDTNVSIRVQGYKVEKEPGKVTIFVEVPGCSHKDVQVALADGILTVRAKSALQRAEQKFQFRVGKMIDSSDITAKVVDGLLTLTAKADQQPAPPQGTVTVSPG